MGKLKSLVNKFLAANRLHGLVIVPILTLDPVFGFLVPINVKVFYCRSVDVILFYLSLNFWTNSFIIAVIRFDTAQCVLCKVYFSAQPSKLS